MTRLCNINFINIFLPKFVALRVDDGTLSASRKIYRPRIKNKERKELGARYEKPCHTKKPDNNNYAKSRTMSRKR